MVHFLRTTIIAIEESTVTLQLPDGNQMVWPIHALQTDTQYLSSVRVGEELTITLSRTSDIINELLLSYPADESATAASASPL